MTSAVVASVAVPLSVRVDGDGILLRGETVKTVEVTANGTVRELLVSEGDLIEPGQVVARLDVQNIESEIRTVKDRIRLFEGQRSVDERNMSRMMDSFRRQLSQLEEQKQAKQRLLEKQLARKQDVAAIDAQMASVRAQMYQQQLGSTGRSNELEEQRRRLRQLEEQLASNTTVKSTHGGRVAAVLKPVGQVIQAGERLINLEEPEAPFHVLLFVPFAEGKKVQPGMTVRISPSTVKPEEFGYILGEIESISSQAVTFEEVQSTLNNDRLASGFAQDTPFRVRAVPLLDASTVSGFQWTSSGGPPTTIGANTPVTAQIVVDRRLPISYVIPTVKKTLGAN